MSSIDERADALRRRFPDGPVQPPYWWTLARPVVKIACQGMIAVPGILAATHGVELPPLLWAVLTIMATIAGYGLSEMSPGFRPRT